jgi:hypothetical protein
MKKVEKKSKLLEKGMKQLASMSDAEMKKLFPQLSMISCCGVRNRIFTLESTFFLFMWQILSMTSCVETVQRVLLRMSFAGGSKASASSSAYCQARGRLPDKLFEKIFSDTACVLEEKVDKDRLWYGKRVRVVDGTSISIPDTPENQTVYPQPSCQKPGCGFPMMRILAVFSLASGALLSYVQGPLSDGENSLLKKIIKTFSPGDIILADRGFCSFAIFAELIAMSVDALIRMREKIIKNYVVIRKFGKDDCIIKWLRPMPLRNEKHLPEALYLRMTKYRICRPGFRTESVTVLTTLTDHSSFPSQEFAELYVRRWQAEINLRHLKTTLGMDILKCLSPEMIKKELAMHLIAYNLIRDLMFQAAAVHSAQLRSISFKYSMTIINQWTPYIFMCLAEEQRETLIDEMLLCIAKSKVPERPFRREPRAVKRRPKPYQLLTAPRHIFVEIQHNKKYKKQAQINP